MYLESPNLSMPGLHHEFSSALLTNSPCRIRGLFSVVLARVLDTIEVLDNGFVEVHRIAFIEGVNLASLWDLNIRMSEDELPESRV